MGGSFHGYVKSPEGKSIQFPCFGEVPIFQWAVCYEDIYPLVNVQKTMENHHFSWENSLFLWPFSIAMLVYQRVQLLFLVKSLYFNGPFSIAFCMFTRGYIRHHRFYTSMVHQRSPVAAGPCARGLLWSHGAPHRGTFGGAALGDAVLHAATAAWATRSGAARDIWRYLEISGDILESWGYQIYVYIYI